MIKVLGNNISAEYGTSEKSINVTSKFLKTFLNNDIIHIPINANFNFVFGDLVPLYKKRLVLTINDNKHVIIENNKIEFKTKLNVRSINPVPIKYIDVFKNKHKGRDIYIVCSGKSCDYIDKSFFNNKITIGVNQVYKKFQTTYLVRKENNYLKKVVTDAPNSIHCITEGNFGGDNKENIDSFKNDPTLHNKKIYFIKHVPNTLKITFPQSDNLLVTSHSTTSTAVHLAAYMGADNIILVGHDCGVLNGETNFTGYYSDIKSIPGKNYDKWLLQVTNDICILKKWLKEKYNCNVYSLNPFTNLRLDGNKFI
jgi:hypothetical protein